MIESYAGCLFEPVCACSQIFKRVFDNPICSELLCRQHIKFTFWSIHCDCSGICRMDTAVLTSFLEVHQNDTVAASCSVDSRCRTVLEDINGFYVGRVDVGQVTARHSVHYNERSVACTAG